jgi:hypothetical protein
MSSYRVRPSACAIAVAVALAIAPGAGARQTGEPVRKLSDKVADADVGLRRQGFSVVLLLGDMRGGESLEGVPTAARKALTDMKDFLPYKNYRLLDSQWTLCCSGSSSAITRLRGVDDQEYELELRASPVLASKGVGIEPGALSVRFVLRELSDMLPGMPKGDPGQSTKGSAADARMSHITQEQELFALERERLDLESQVVNLRGAVEVGMKDPTELKRAQQQLGMVSQRIMTLKNELNASTQAKTAGGLKAVIDTSFRIDVGETVVVGSSGLRGGSKALIALLTAVGKRPKS